MPDSVAVKALLIVLALAAAASAQTTTRTMQLRFVPVERALEAARAVSGVVATADRRTNRLVISGPPAGVETASERAMRADLPEPPQAVTLVIGDGGSSPVWAVIANVDRVRPTSLSVETPGGVARGATAVKGRLWLEGAPGKLAFRAELQVKTAAGPVDLAGRAALAPEKAVRVAAAGALTLDATLRGPAAPEPPEAGR